MHNGYNKQERKHKTVKKDERDKAAATRATQRRVRETRGGKAFCDRGRQRDGGEEKPEQTG